MASADFFAVAYGLVINSGIALPELMPFEGDGRAPDVVIRLEQSAELHLNTHTPFEFHIEQKHAVLAWRNVGRFLLYDGHEIVIEPAPGVSHQTLRSYLLGQVLAILMYQRGLLVLHASAAALQDENGQWNAVGFLGDSGEGKSTMVAQLHALGHRLICDDVIAIPASDAQDSQTSKNKLAPCIFPGAPQLRLWPQSLAALGRDTEELPVLPHHPQRRVLRDAESFEMAGVPLRHLYVLSSGDCVENTPLHASHAVMQLARYSYCAGALSTAEIPLHFRQCGAVANSVPMSILQRPRDLSRLLDVAAIVENGALSGSGA